ncbi:glycine receptor subunit alpha-2 [Trichonephila inaurata madagascariensis]|uniref:Glycine receptor subunit alpha-2 n=1 Tax=Trichonephila inaurata madagascariensis TaxID=2747483 RepID=A0A8X7CM61_9ARAC|nr:glycine receptor subunit alpha-2 [Trichonephila inaurata madagascariensis]
MSMLTFWIPHDAVPARITLGVTSLLTIITKQYQASMPNVSYIVALNVWLSCCIAFVFFSLLEFAAVIAMSTKAKRKPKSVFRDSPDLILPMVRCALHKHSYSNVT